LVKNLASHLLSRNLKVRIQRTIILPVVLHGNEVWSLTLRDKHRPRVFKIRVLRKMFGCKRGGHSWRSEKTAQ
jgi:hypothetical protein